MNDPKVWVPLLIGLINLMILPVARVLFRAEVKDILDVHNKDMDAHPELKSVAKLELRFDKLDDKIDKLRDAVGKITPRRRAEDGLD